MKLGNPSTPKQEHRDRRKSGLKAPEPQYVISPWEDLVIDLRTITSMGFRAAGPAVCGIASPDTVLINGRAHLNQSREVWQKLKSHVLAWHEWRVGQAAPMPNPDSQVEDGEASKGLPVR